MFLSRGKSSKDWKIGRQNIPRVGNQEVMMAETGDGENNFPFKIFFRNRGRRK
jgi:hypothetical protein